jgi:hypothetical protein
MPSSIQTQVEYYLQLRDAIFDMKRVVSQNPGDKELLSIQMQLEATEQWTRGGKAPTLAQKGQLNFGLLASKYLHDIEPDLASRIYEIASYVTYWK